MSGNGEFKGRKKNHRLRVGNEAKTHRGMKSKVPRKIPHEQTVSFWSL
jgi:hypothetical protein